MYPLWEKGRLNKLEFLKSCKREIITAFKNIRMNHLKWNILKKAELLSFNFLTFVTELMLKIKSTKEGKS